MANKGFNYIQWALNLELPKASYKSVLMSIACCANNTTGEAYPSADFLVRTTCLDRGTVFKALKYLKDIKILLTKGTKKRKGIVVYSLNKELTNKDIINNNLPFINKVPVGKTTLQEYENPHSTSVKIHTQNSKELSLTSNTLETPKEFLSVCISRKEDRLMENHPEDKNLKKIITNFYTASDTATQTPSPFRGLGSGSVSSFKSGGVSC